MNAADRRRSAYAARDTGLGVCVDGMLKGDVGLTQGVTRKRGCARENKRAGRVKEKLQKPVSTSFTQPFLRRNSEDPVGELRR